MVIKAVTDKFMDAIGHGDTHETLEEEEVVEGMVVKLVKRRFDEETTKKEVAKVRIFDRDLRKHFRRTAREERFCGQAGRGPRGRVGAE